MEWWPAHPDLLVFSSTWHRSYVYRGRPTVVNTDGSNYQVLDDFGCSRFALSNDGEKIAYNCHGEARIYHWGIGAEIFDPSQYGQTFDSYLQAAWSPDSQYLAWAGSGEFSGDGHGIVIFDMVNQTSSVLHTYVHYPWAADCGTLLWLSWSPDGTKITFMALAEYLETESDPAETEIKGPNGVCSMSHLYIIDVNTLEKVYIDWGGGFIWSPDGTKMAYNNHGIWIYEVESHRQ